MNIESALYYYNDGKYDESLEICRRLLEIYPDYTSANWRIFYIYIRQGKDIEAISELQKILLSDTSTVKHSKVVKNIYQKSGINGVISFLIESELMKSTPSIMRLANWYAILNKKEETLNWLEKALNVRSQNW